MGTSAGRPLTALISFPINPIRLAIFLWDRLQWGLALVYSMNMSWSLRAAIDNMSLGVLARFMTKFSEIDCEEADTATPTVGAMFLMMASNCLAQLGEECPMIEQNSLSLANVSANWGNCSVFKSFLDLVIWSLIYQQHEVPVRKSGLLCLYPN